MTPLYAALNCVGRRRTLYPQPTAYKQQKTAYLQLMKDLLDHGAKPNVRLKEKVWYQGYNFDLSGVDETGATPFWRAAYADDIEAMKLLMAHGADPNDPDDEAEGPPSGGDGQPGRRGCRQAENRSVGPAAGEDRWSGRDAAARGLGRGLRRRLRGQPHRYAPTGMLAAVKYLVEELHADVNESDADGNTALHNAAARGDNEMILYLVSKGANVKAVNRKGQTTRRPGQRPGAAHQPVPRNDRPAPEAGRQAATTSASPADRALKTGPAEPDTGFRGLPVLPESRSRPARVLDWIP